jgi:hypothetical protein
MHLLEQDLSNAPAGSYSAVLKSMIDKLKACKSEAGVKTLSYDDLVQLVGDEIFLQEFDNSLGLERRNYIHEIMAELIIYS